MPWEATIVEQFRLITYNTPDESQYYGPYITLLTDLFPHEERYQLGLQCKGPALSIDLTVLYIMPRLGYKVPVLSITIKPSVHLHNLAMRERADSQMRDRFRELGCPDLPVAKLYGICAMGTSFAVYEYTQETNRVSPPSTPRDPDVLNDVAPSARWEYELLEAGGEAKLRSIVAEVKAMAEAIEY